LIAKNRSDMTDEELKHAERTFINYFTISGNATESARVAGFLNPDENGYRLKHQLIKNELINYVDFKSMTLEEQREWLKQFFCNVIANSRVLMRDRINCAKTLAQILKMFTDEVEISEETSNALSKLSYDELIKIAYNK